MEELVSDALPESLSNLFMQVDGKKWFRNATCAIT